MCIRLFALLCVAPLLTLAAPPTPDAKTLRAAKDAAWRDEARRLEPAPALPPVTPEVVGHGPRDQKLVALTFDACSTRDVSQYDERITKTLVETHTPATIFLGGAWTLEEAEHVKYLASQPQFELGNHTWSHPHMPRLTPDEMKTQLLRTQAAIYSVTGRQPRLFRPPYGEYDHRVVQAAGAVGLATIEYDLASGDPDKHATRERLVEWVLLKAKAGSIVVMHLNHLKFHTAEALPGIIAGLRAKGFTLVTVGELLHRAPDEERTGEPGPSPK